MSIRLGTSMMRRTRPRFLRTRKLDWTTDGIDFLRLYRCAGPLPHRSRLQSRPVRAPRSARLGPGQAGKRALRKLDEEQNADGRQRLSPLPPSVHGSLAAAMESVRIRLPSRGTENPT